MNNKVTGKKLKIFMRGKSVSSLQSQLKQRGFTITDVPGVFGPSTRDAVKSLQSQMSLKATGIVDETFWQAIGQSFAPSNEKTEKMDEPLNAQLDSTSHQLESVIKLLIQKGVINQQELDSMINDHVDDQPPAKPLFL